MTSTDTGGVVDRQLTAWNAADVDAFCACHTDDVVMTGGPGEVVATGIGELRERFLRRCKEWPRATATRTRRVQVGDFVVDEEEFVDFPIERAIAVYRVREGLIDHVSILR